MRALFCSNAAIVEEGIRLNLTVTDTPGFGDRIDNTNWYNEIPFFLNVKEKEKDGFFWNKNC